MREWKAFEKQHGANPTKWGSEAKTEGQRILKEFAMARTQLMEIDRQEAARFVRRGMPNPEEL